MIGRYKRMTALAKDASSSSNHWIFLQLCKIFVLRSFLTVADGF